MYSNIITPPDRIETILIVDAADTDVKDLMGFFKTSTIPYNVYLYSHDMNNLSWLTDKYKIADTVLQAHGSSLPVDGIKFGPDQDLKRPLDYFNK